MADEKSKNLTGADGPGKDPAKEDKKPEIPKEQKAENKTPHKIHNSLL